MIKTPNVKHTKRKAEADASDYEHYADVITAYRGLLRETALDEDIRLRKGRAQVPKKREDLLEWVRDRDNLDLVAESFRRTCSGYVSTDRLFAVCSGPVSFDWPAVISMLQTSEDVMGYALNFLEIGHRGKLQAEAEELEDIMGLLKDLRERIQYADLMGSLPDRPVGKDLHEEVAPQDLPEAV